MNELLQRVDHSSIDWKPTEGLRKERATCVNSNEIDDYSRFLGTKQELLAMPFWEVYTDQI